MAPGFVFLSSLATAAALTCLPDAVPESQRKNVTIQGVSMPLGYHSLSWESALILKDIWVILMTEVLGINAKDMGVSSNAAQAWWLIGGCENKLGNTFEERQCMQPGFIPECHVIMEMWKNPLTGLIKEYDTWNADLAPVVAKELSYAGSEFLSVFPKAIDLAAQDGIALNFYQSWNASWSNMSRYFSRITDIDFAELANCSAMYKLKVTSFLDTFEEVTGYQGAVVNGEFVCWQDKWLLGPGCRDPDRPELCVPFITAFGWLAESSIQKIFAYNTAMAYGEANTWGLYLDIPRRHDVVVYWWSPDSNFKDMNPSKVIFPGPSNSVAWGNMQRTAQYPESTLVTVLNRALVENSDEWNAKAVKLSKRIDITNPEMDAAMLGLYEKTVANGWSYTNFFNEACEFIKDNWGKVSVWIPSDVECTPGTGVSTASGGRDVRTLEEAASCNWCPPGRYSEAFTLPNAAGTRFVSTYRCSQCAPGQKQPVGGSTSCETCSAGSFSSQPGATACALCRIGSYMGSRGAAECQSCRLPMVTGQEGSLFVEQCQCPRGTVRPCRYRGTMRSECRCNNTEIYQPNTGAACIPCPAGLICELAADEKDLPCTAAMESPELNYPRPMPEHYTSAENPLSVYKCKDSWICPGNALGKCGPHATGTACGFCEDGYYREVSGHCSQCSAAFRLPIFPVLLMLGGPVALVVMMKLGTKDVLKSQRSIFNEMLGIGYVTLIFMQTLGTNVGILPTAPAAVSDMLSWTPAVSDIASQFRLQCFVSMSFGVEFALKLLAPFYGGVVFLLLYILSRCIPRLHLDKDVIIGTYGGLLNAFVISIVNLSLTLFQTYQHPNGLWSMISAPGVITSSDLWHSLVGGTVFCVMVYCIGGVVATIYALCMAPTHFKDPGFRKRWKFLFLQVRPSAYWWITCSIVKALFLSLTTVIFDSAVAQTVWLGTGLVLYFLSVFWFLPWRASSLLFLDVSLHYVLTVLCLVMPFFIPASATELLDVVAIFIVVCFVGVTFSIGCVLGIVRTQSPNVQRKWRLSYEKSARQLVEVFQVMDDPVVLSKVLQGLSDVDFRLSIDVMKVLSVELLGNKETGRLIWRQHGRMSFNKQQERGPDKPENF